MLLYQKNKLHLTNSLLLSNFVLEEASQLNSNL